jgi:prephenate dehydrogenase
MRLVIMGFGLLGASLALALRERRAGVTVTGVDLSAAVLGAAAARRAADALLDAADEPRVRAAVISSDMVVLATPVRQIEANVSELLEYAPTVTDCGSTKRSVSNAAVASRRRERFVPGHPMAGGADGGVENARGDLFLGNKWILCPEGCAEDALAKAEDLVRAVGAVPVQMSAEEHDRAVAWTSHVPQIVASAIAALTHEAEAEMATGPAFLSVTRAAGGAENMWRDIFDSNADRIAPALRRLVCELDGVAAALSRKETDSVPALDLLRRARALRRHT